MKGIELPINILVIVAIAVIVLLGMVALYFAGWTPFGSSMGVEAIKNSECIEYTRTNQCAQDPNDVIIDYDVDGDPDTDDTLQDFTAAFYGCGTDITCTRQICACPGY